MGILIGGTGEPGPTPSGEVMPNVGPGNTLIPPTCAETEPQPKRTAAVVATTWRVIMGPTLFGLEFAMRPPLHCAARHRANECRGSEFRSNGASSGVNIRPLFADSRQASKRRL